MPRSAGGIAFVATVVAAAAASGFIGDWKAPPPQAPPAKTKLYFVESRVSAQVIDLHRVNWKAASVPGRVCGLRRGVRLRAGKAHVSSRLEVDAGWHRVVYGDLDGANGDEAGLSVACTNGGGTADSVLSYAVVVFRAGTSSAVPIGILRPRHQAPQLLPTLLEVDIDRHRVVGREAFYGPNDGTCCPSGRARTVWTYRHRTFRVATSRVTKKPG